MATERWLSIKDNKLFMHCENAGAAYFRNMEGIDVEVSMKDVFKDPNLLSLFMTDIYELPVKEVLKAMKYPPELLLEFSEIDEEYKKQTGSVWGIRIRDLPTVIKEMFTACKVR